MSDRLHCNTTVLMSELQVSWYADTGKRTCPLIKVSAAGSDSDVLAAEAMKGHSTLATACYNGEVGACAEPLTGSSLMFTC